MKEIIIDSILQDMLSVLTNEQLMKLKSVLFSKLQDSLFQKRNNYSMFSESHENNQHYLQKFLSSKKVEGCSVKTIHYYESTITNLFCTLKKPVRQITTDDLREYLEKYQQDRMICRTTLDNMRRILSSFFGWMEDEDLIIKSPVRRIHKVKAEKQIKEIYSDEQLEILRDNCTSLRDLAMIDILASTGMRVGELVHLKKEDINFVERECVVFGKGNKARVVYFDARTKLHLQDYLQSRNDDNSSVFVSLKIPSRSMTIGAIESRLRKYGEKLNIGRVHPHKFRRTLATVAIDKGMPIEQVQQLLGHQKIDTTLHYALVKQHNVKMSHRKFIG